MNGKVNLGSENGNESVSYIYENLCFCYGFGDVVCCKPKDSGKEPLTVDHVPQN